MTAQLQNVRSAPVTREHVIAFLAQHRAENATIPDSLWRWAEEETGRQRRHLRRIVGTYATSGHLPAPVKRERQALENEDAAKLAYFMNAGCALSALDQLHDWGMNLDMRQRTFERRVNEWEMPLRAAAKGGYKEMIKHQMFNTEHIPHRGYAYSMDHTKLPIRILPTKGEKPIFPWLTVVLDMSTRYILGWIITESDAIIEDNVAVLIEAIMGSEIDGQFFGGKPQFLRTDRGSDFVSKAMVRGLLNEDIGRQFTEPYSSWQNGRVERLHGTIDRDFAPTKPGFVKGGEEQYALRVMRVVTPVESLMTRDDLDISFGQWAAAYNRRPHRALGKRSPLQAWVEDTHPIKVADQHQLRLAMMRTQDRVGQHYGIEFRGRIYAAPRLGGNDVLGQTVQVRYHEHRTEYVEIFVNNEWVCTAFASEKMPQGQRIAVVATRNAQRDKAAQLSRLANYENVLVEREAQRERGVSAGALPHLPVLTQKDKEAANLMGRPWTELTNAFDAAVPGSDDLDVEGPAVQSHSAQAAKPVRGSRPSRPQHNKPARVRPATSAQISTITNLFGGEPA